MPASARLAQQTGADMKSHMDAMYRLTRHIYDASRKYYLLGRDQAISRLNSQPGEYVCEVGCGTARNLIKMAQAYPESCFMGFDISDEMLKTARGSLARKVLSDKISLAQGSADNFDPKTLFDLERPLDKIVFSYALSIIPVWRESLDHALSLLPSGGEIHIIDFGSQENLPRAFRAFLFWWLKQFHVFYKPEIEIHLKQRAAEGKGTLLLEHYYGGYCYRAVFKKT